MAHPFTVARCLLAFQIMWIMCAVGIEIPYSTEGDGAYNGDPLVPDLDWEALIQSSAGVKMKIAGDGRIDNDMDIGGVTKVGGTFDAVGKATFAQDVEVRGKTLNHGGQQFVLGMQDGTKQLNKRENRALYHHSKPEDSLHVNFGGDFEGGVVVGGPETLIEGTLVAKGKMTSEKDLEVKGSALMIGTGDGKNQGSVSTNRAVVHGDDDILIVNQEGDFEGGVHMQGKKVFVDGKMAVGKGFVTPEADIHVKTAEPEAVLMFSSSTKEKNSVFVKGKGGTGGGMDMVIGDTAGGSGKLVVEFKGDINFLGDGITSYKRGETVFTTGSSIGGHVGVGANSLGGSHGITVDTSEKEGHTANDIALKKGSLHFFGGLYDTSSKGKWHLDLDKSGHVKALNIQSAVGVGTVLPKSEFGDTKEALIHMVDGGRPVITLESTAEGGHSTIVFKTGKAQYVIDQVDTMLKFTSANKDMLVLDNAGKVGIGRSNNGEYGVNLHIAEGINNPLNDLAIPHGNLRLKGKIFDTFDGGDKFYLDPSGMSNVKDIGMEGKLHFKGVPQPAQFHVEVPKGDAHIAVGRSLFLNGFGGDSARVTNNAVVDNTGKWALHDATKLASAIELRNNGKIEMLATKDVGKMDWQMLLGMDGTKDSVYAFGKFGINMKEPEHTFHMPGDESTMSLGNNLFLAGAPTTGGTSRITANAFMRAKQWKIQRADRFAASIDLKDSGGIDMYGTDAQGAVQWKKMFGFDTPKKKVYAFGKFGIETENPTHTLTLPSGEHHISLGDKLFLNGEGDKTRVMGNCLMQQGKLSIADKGRQAVSIELDSGVGKLKFGGTQSRGSDAFLNLLTVDFTNKATVVESGRLGVRTGTPKSAVDVRGHINLQDPSNAGVLYTPSSGKGLFLRASDAPGTYNSNQERFFFGNNFLAGFGTIEPKAKLHLVHQKDETAPHLKLETEGAQFDVVSTKEGLNFATTTDGLKYDFKIGEISPLTMTGKNSEATANEVKYKETTVLLVPGGGRAAVGGLPQGQHNLQLFGTGMMITGTEGTPNSGALAFANDGGGKGFQLDYDAAIMKFSSLPPTAHLKTDAPLQVHMAVLDTGRVGVGTTEPRSAFTVKADDGITVENQLGKYWTYLTTADGHLEFQSGKGGYFKFKEDGSMQMTKTPSTYKLVVDGTGMLLTGGPKDKAPLVFDADGGGKGFSMDYYKEKMQFGHQDGSKWHMTMTDDGLMGMGTPSPEHAVHVKHDTGIAIEHSSSGALKWTIATSARASLGFSYKGAPKVTVTKDGFVGIGTEAPTKALHVEGDVFVSGKMHVDNNYLKKKAAQLAAPTPAEEVALDRLEGAEALIQLDEHVSAKMDDDSFGMIHRPESSKATEAVDYASLVTVMHRVVQEHQAEIRALRERVASLESRY